MSNNNIAFEGNPENIQRFLLQHEFQSYYKQFDAEARRRKLYSTYIFSVGYAWLTHYPTHWTTSVAR